MQVVMPLDLRLRIPEGDPLGLLIEITEEMDYRDLEAAYERRETAGEATAKQLFQLVIFGYLNGYYTLRKLCDACRYDLRMIHLREGNESPATRGLKANRFSAENMPYDEQTALPAPPESS